MRTGYAGYDEKHHLSRKWDFQRIRFQYHISQAILRLENNFLGSIKYEI